jgi:hypothetical protein
MQKRYYVYIKQDYQNFKYIEEGVLNLIDEIGTLHVQRIKKINIFGNCLGH